MTRARSIAMFALVLLLAQPAAAGPISNSATGSSGGIALDGTQATISLNRLDNEISGRVFEDADFAGTAADWDSGVGDLGLQDVDVELYDASDDSWVDSVTTGAGGVFTFTGVPDGTYKVRVRSETIGDADTPPAGGLNGTVPASWPYPLPEMTWGDGSALYGGQDSTVDDTATADDAGPGDTWVSVAVSSADVTDVNFGFAYNLIVDTADDANADNVRSRQGSLRQFIKSANAIGTAGGTTANSSRFRIPGAGPHTIQPVRTLPVIDDPVILDGTTQPGFVAAPIVLLDGVSAGAAVDGISFANGSDASTLAGLALIRFTRDGVLVQAGADNLTISGNWIGTDGSGLTTVGNGDEGIEMFAAGATIGGTGANDGNVITNNGDDGINLDGAAATGNTILGNRIHSNDLLGIDLGNDGVTANDGSDLDSGPNGLLNFPAITTASESAGTVAVDFDLDVPAGWHRIEFFRNTAADPSGNGEGETFVDFVNVDHPGGGVQSFSYSFAGAVGDILTATTTECTDGPTCNAFGNTSEFGATATVVVTRSIGGRVLEDVNGNGAVGDDGVGRDNVTILLYRDGGDNLRDGVDDVFLSSTTTDGAGNYSFSGIADGTYWAAVDSTTVTPSDGLNATFTQDDVWAEQTWAGANRVFFNGVIIATAAAPGAHYGGVRVDRSDDASGLGTSEHLILVTVAGSDVADVDFGFSFNAVTSTRDDDDEVASNRTVQGSLRQFIQSANAIVGLNSSRFAMSTLDSNYDLSGNGEFTIPLTLSLPNVTDSAVLDGTTQSGFSGNPIIELDGGAAVPISAQINDILYISAGGTTVRGFVIHSSPDEAITLISGDGNLVETNFIGTDVTGSIPKGSAGNGITLRSSSSGNRIGGTAAGQANIIAHSAQAGILVSNGSGNTLLRNSISSNSGLGIDLAGGGVTANDPGDGDAGANDLLNFPVITSAVDSAGTVDVDFTLDVPGGWHRIEFFRNTAADPSGYGEGETFVDSIDVDHPGGGSQSFSHSFAGAAGDIITATTTECTDGASCLTFGSTSEFSGAVAVVQGIDLSITKDDGQATYVPGGTVTYTITVSNAGPGDSVNASVADSFDVTRLTNINWSCVATGTADCGATAGGTGDISVNDVDVAAGAGNFLTYTVTADVLASATGDLVNTATVTANNETDLAAGNNSATDTDTLAAEADLSILKSDGVATYVPGGSLVYTITVDNAGPSDVIGATVADSFPAELTNITWTCAAVGGASCGAANGSGDISETVDVPVGGTVTYTVNVDVLASATGALSNTATVTAPAGVTDPNLTDNTSTDTDTEDAQADLSILKSDGVATYVPGGSLVYTITVDNAGPSDVIGATVADSFPAELTNITWTCAAVGGASCGAANGSGDISETVDVPVGGTVTYTVNVDVLASATGALANTATVTAPAGVTDPNLTDNTSTDTDTEDAQADLSILKSDGVATYVPGGSLVYTIAIDNAGPSDVIGATVADSFPAELTNVTWTCAAIGGASCGAANGSGDISETVDVPVGGTVTYTVNVDVLASATGALANTATVTAPAGVTDPNLTDNTSTDTDTEDAQADLSILKSDGVATYVPGGSLVYTIAIDNAGPSDVIGATVADSFPAELTNVTWTCAAIGGASCGAANGSGDISETVDVPVGGTVTYTVNVDVLASATGPLANTATVTAPAGVTDPNLTDNTSTDTDTEDAQADLSILKSDGVATYVPGGSLVYTIAIDNAGPSDVIGATVADSFPAELTNITWTCAAVGGASCGAANGSGDISETVDVPVGGTVTYTVNVDVLASATGALSNTATVTAPAGVTDPNLTDNTSTDTDTEDAQADLSILKSDGVATYVPGGSLVYTITVDNAGPSDVIGATVADSFPAELTNITWTCAAVGGASCGAANGSGDISETVDVPVGGTVTYTVNVDVLASATGALSNTATVTAPAGVTDPNLTDNTSTDTDTEDAQADLSILKSDGVATYVPGGSLVYTIAIDNAGPSDVIGATVADSFPAELTNVTWTCAAVGGASCGAANGSGDISETVDVPVGGTVTYTVNVDVLASATGALSNTATVTAPAGVTDPNLTDNTSTDTDTEDAQADLSILKSDGVATYVPGGSLVYTIAIDNAGPSDVIGATVADSFPAELTNVTWTCAAVGGASCGAANGSGDISETVDVPVGGTVTYTVNVDVLASATGALANTATVTAPAGVTDPNLTDNTSTDTDTEDAQADLSITKDDGVGTYTPGGSLVYAIVVSNAGPANVIGATVTDNFPAELTNISWSCAAAGSASCGAATGSGNINETVNVPVGGTVTYTVNVDVLASATGALSNTATVAVPASVTDTDLTNDSATDTDTEDAQADLSITKDDGVGTYTPGGSLVYSIVVSNSGPANVIGATVTDNFPAELTNISWSCAAAGGATCGAATGTGNIAETVDVPVGGTVTYTANVDVLASAIGALANTATVTVPGGITDPSPANNSATDTDVPPAQADLSLTKTVDNGAPAVNGTVVFTLTVNNAGPGTATGVAVADLLPSGYSYVSDDASGAYAPVAGIWNLGSLAAGANAVLNITATANSTGNYTNVAEISAADQPDPDSIPGNGSTTEDDDDSATTAPLPVADLSLALSVDVSTPDLGSDVIFTVDVRNDGPNDATGIVAYDALPSGYTYLADDGGGAYDGLTGNWTVGPLAAGATATLRITANVNTGGDYMNAAEVMTADQLDPDSIPGNGLGQGEDDEATLSTFPNGSQTLLLAKTADVQAVTVGRTVTYRIEISNTTASEMTDVRIEDFAPPTFKYVQGSTRIDGSAAPDPAGERTLVFQIGTVPALDDTNGNGRADSGEQGFRTLSYRLFVSVGAVPGEYRNVAVARNSCESCEISNEASATVDVVIDELFDLANIIGKVFEDRDGDGRQDPDEPGVHGAMVALDDGTYALTDDFGRYHFPAVLPGHRMVKINLKSLPAGATATTRAGRVLWITPGLLARADFGIAQLRETKSVGRPEEHGLGVRADDHGLPVEVHGNAETLTAFVNGREVMFRTNDVKLGVERLEESVRVRGQTAVSPIVFALDSEVGQPIDRWELEVLDAGGRVVRTFSGEGSVPATVSWNGQIAEGTPLDGGEIYQYRLTVDYADGIRSRSGTRVFGVDRSEVISLELMGGAFISGSDALSPTAREALDESIAVLRKYPDENIVIEGHTDSVGASAYNLDLSRRRAEAAASYLGNVGGIPRDRLVVRYFGEDRPVAPNELEEARALNRRVEVRGSIDEVASAAVLDVYRAAPRVSINGAAIDVGRHGQFSHRMDDGELPRDLFIEASDSTGHEVNARVRLPSLDVDGPAGTFVVPNGAAAHDCRVSEVAGDFAETELVCRIHGTTDGGNTLEVDGQPLGVAGDGSFTVDVRLDPGRNVVDLLARNPAGYGRVVAIEIDVTDRDEEGRRIVVREAIPNLTVQLPPEGVKLASSRISITGRTDPGNSVEANGQPLEVRADGSFSGLLELPTGPSLLVVRATDDQGREATISQAVEVAKNQLFLLAFADGVVGRMSGSGMIEGAGLEEEDEYYTEGRVAFYLKGMIAGKYLIASSFDSRRGEFGELFSDLNGSATDRLLTNLDPDRIYPVYGDDSSVVFDAQSRGKFYLALDSDTIHAVVGNYPLALTDTELAAYVRTFYGARFLYQSASKTRFGKPNTEVVLFAADVQQIHVTDALRATGGSLYYLSHVGVIMGSEEITLTVRDKRTGVVLRRQRQRQNVDYTIKYPEGRVMFHRPIRSVEQDAYPIDLAILSGNPVFIEADYEARVEDFEEAATGGRVRQQIGDRVALGVTRIDDQVQSGSYELSGVDGEVRLGQHTRLLAEYAESQGNASRSFVSNDGGLTYTAATPTGDEEGTAWKAAAELDIGEWFGSPERYQVKVYFKDLAPGFFSNGNLLEQGTRKIGASGLFRITEKDSLVVSRDEVDRSSSLLTEGSTESTITSAQWNRRGERWNLSVEYQANEVEDESGESLVDTELLAARYRHRITKKLTGGLEHQETLSGRANDQTTLGVEYQALKSMALQLQATEGDLGRSALGGAVLTLGESEIYVTKRLSDNPAGETTSTIVGARSPLGAASRVYSEYQWERADAGDRSISLFGIQRQWDPSPGFRFLLGGESANVEADSGNRDRTALTGSMTYSNGERLTALTRTELRFDRGERDEDQWVTFNKVDYKLGAGLTLLGKYSYSKTEDRDTDEVEARLEVSSIGLAYRPVHNDRFNALFRYTRLVDLRPVPAGPIEQLDRTSDVLALDTVLEINRRLEWVAKVAARDVDEQDTESRVYLGIQRFNVNLWRPVYLGAEYRILGEAETGDKRQGFLGELLWEVVPHFRIGGGYNFTDFSDNEFSSNDYDVHGWFLRVQGTY